jgi:hypothetical protein
LLAALAGLRLLVLLLIFLGTGNRLGLLLDLLLLATCAAVRAWVVVVVLVGLDHLFAEFLLAFVDI